MVALFEIGAAGPVLAKSQAVPAKKSNLFQRLRAQTAPPPKTCKIPTATDKKNLATYAEGKAKLTNQRLKGLLMRPRTSLLEKSIRKGLDGEEYASAEEVREKFLPLLSEGLTSGLLEAEGTLGCYFETAGKDFCQTFSEGGTSGEEVTNINVRLIGGGWLKLKREQPEDEEEGPLDNIPFTFSISLANIRLVHSVTAAASEPVFGEKGKAKRIAMTLFPGFAPSLGGTVGNAQWQLQVGPHRFAGDEKGEKVLVSLNISCKF